MWPLYILAGFGYLLFLISLFKSWGWKRKYKNLLEDIHKVDAVNKESI
jgi:hypothetical protein